MFFKSLIRIQSVFQESNLHPFFSRRFGSDPDRGKLHLDQQPSGQKVHFKGLHEREKRQINFGGPSSSSSSSSPSSSVSFSNNNNGKVHFFEENYVVRLMRICTCEPPSCKVAVDVEA